MPNCVCCAHLSTKTQITLSVYGRQFSIINDNELDWTPFDLVYVIHVTRTETNCGKQYVEQDGRFLKTKFREHFCKMQQPEIFDTFLFSYFKNNGYSPRKALILPAC